MILHRGRAFEARDLAALAAGSDPMAAIGAKVGEYVANQQQADLYKCLEGVFGSLTGSDSPLSTLCVLTPAAQLPSVPVRWLRLAQFWAIKATS